MNDVFNTHTRRCKDGLLQLYLDATDFRDLLATAGQDPRSYSADYQSWLDQLGDDGRVDQRRWTVELLEAYLDLGDALGTNGRCSLTESLRSTDLLEIAVALLYGPPDARSADVTMPTQLAAP